MSCRRKSVRVMVAWLALGSCLAWHGVLPVVPLCHSMRQTTRCTFVRGRQVLIAINDDIHGGLLLCCGCGCCCSEAHDWQPLLAPMAMSSAAGSRSPSCPAFIRRMAPTQELQQQDWPAGLSRRLDSTGLQWRENSRRSMVGCFTVVSQQQPLRQR